MLKLLIIALAIFSSPASAEEQYGMAMVGTPKYNAQSTHLDYANPEAPKGGTLKQAVNGSFDTLNPLSLIHI